MVCLEWWSNLIQTWFELFIRRNKNVRRAKGIVLLYYLLIIWICAKKSESKMCFLLPFLCTLAPFSFFCFVFKKQFSFQLIFKDEKLSNQFFCDTKHFLFSKNCNTLETRKWEHKKIISEGCLCTWDTNTCVVKCESERCL